MENSEDRRSSRNIKQNIIHNNIKGLSAINAIWIHSALLSTKTFIFDTETYVEAFTYENSLFMSTRILLLLMKID